MNINDKRWWLLAICVTVGRLTAPIECAGLEWEDSFGVDRYGRPSIELNVPKTNQGWIITTLYQQLDSGEWSLIHGPVQLQMQPNDNQVEWPIELLKFKGETKIVKAKIEYPRDVIMKSKTFDVMYQTKGDDSFGTLEWMNSLKVDLNDNWEIQLRDVPSFGHDSYSVTLYQKLEGDKWVKLQECTEFNHPPDKNTVTLSIPGSKFQGDSKIVMADVTYPDNSMLESKIIELKESTGEPNKKLKAVSMIGVIVGCVVGGVCLVVLVVGCILCQKRTRRRVPLQQPVTPIFQGRVCQTTHADAVVLDGKTYYIPQVNV